MAERLIFSDPMPYNSMLAAEHAARYLLAKPFCAGRRVLDIACGEGYGSALMATWGACEVCGVDVSSDAVANASRLFGGPGVRFLQHDAMTCAELVDTLGHFDLIVCFETIEHVTDAAAMLQGFKVLSADNAAIMISCPNDAAIVSDRPNEFHMKIYSVEEFTNTVTAVLGEPRSMLLGTSVLGFSAFPASSDLLAPASGIDALMRQEALNAAAISTQLSHEVTGANAAFYVASWGCDLPSAAVVAPISFQAYETPWNMWVAARKGNEQLVNETSTLRARVAAAREENERLADETSTLRARVAAAREENERLADETRALMDRIAAASSAAEELRSQHAEAAAAAQESQRRLDELEASRWYKAAQRYYCLHGHPVAGPMLRTARRATNMFWRRLS